MIGSNELRPVETVRNRVSLSDGFALRTSNLWRVDLAYTLLWVALLLWASLAPGSFWFTGSIEAYPASQVMAACAILTPFLFPFGVYFPFSQTSGSLKSFSSTPSPSLRTTRAYLQQLFACWITTTIPLLSVYMLFVSMSWLGFFKKDPITPILLGLSFLIFVVALTLLTSTTAVGLAMTRSLALHLFATAIALSVIMLPFILSEVVTGTSFESYLVRFVQRIGESPSIFIIPLLLSLLVGSLFSSLYRLKNS